MTLKLLHYLKIWLKEPETFVARYIQNSLTWGDPVIITSELNEVYEAYKDLDTIPVYEAPGLRYNKRSVRGIRRYCRERLAGSNLHYKAVLDLMKKENVDIVHCHHGLQGTIYNRIMEKYGNTELPPFVVSFYGYDATQKPGENKVYRQELASMFNNCTGIFVEGPELRKKVIALGAPPNKIYINPILIPVDEYPNKTSWYRSGEPVTFVCAGRFCEKKGFHLFLEAVGHLKNELPEFTIKLIGEGPMKRVYTEIIERYNLTERVLFPGWKTHMDLLSEIKNGDFFVHPSLTAENGDSEGGAPTVILEAQAIKTPVITSNHADIPNIMGYDNFLCKEGNINSLKETIIHAITCFELEKITKKGYEKVAEDHDISNEVYKKNILNLL